LCVIISLVIHHAQRMRCIVLPSVACLVLLYFSTLSHKRHGFQKFTEKMYWQNKCMFWFSLQLSSETKEEFSEVFSKMFIGVHEKYPLRFKDFYIKLGFSKNIFEKSSNIKFHENPSSGSRVALCGQGDRLMTDRWTDTTKLIVTFPNFESEPKNKGFYFQNTFSIYLTLF
jgi:hypothetical protein